LSGHLQLGDGPQEEIKFTKRKNSRCDEPPASIRTSKREKKTPQLESHSSTNDRKPAVNTSNGNGNGNNSPPPKRTLTRLHKDHRVGARVSVNKFGRDWHGTVTGNEETKMKYIVAFDEEIPSIVKSWFSSELTQYSMNLGKSLHFLDS